MSTYLVTGANRGLGLEFCKQLLERGDAVIATCREPNKATALQDLASEALTIAALDVAKQGTFADLRGVLSDRPLDVLINNAGVWGGPKQTLENLDYEEWQKTLETNLMGPVRVLQTALPLLRKGSRKLAVTITSGMGSIEDNTSGGYIAYRTSKAGVNMAMRSAAHDLRSDGISVVVMNPGWVQTDMGGPSASITPEVSIRNMLGVIDGLSLKDSGKFFNHTGEKYAW